MNGNVLTKIKKIQIFGKWEVFQQIKSFILISIFMSGQLIDYTIQNKKSIALHEGNLDSIGQKNSLGFTVPFIEDRFDMFLKLKSQSIVYLVQVGLINTKLITIELYDKDNHIIETQTIKNKNKNEVSLVEFKQSKSSKKIATKLRVILFNIQSSGEQALGIKYLLVKGEKPEAKNLKRDISKRPNDYFVDARQTPHNVKLKTKETGAIFLERKKNKELTEEEQLKKAMEESKKLAQMQRQTAHFKDESIKMKPEQYKFKEQRNYPLVDFDKIKECLTYVNSAWLQAQKKMEKQKGIRQQHRLSNHIHVKHFHNKNICIDITPQLKKRDLEKKAEMMGAKIMKEVNDNCILITNRTDTQKVSKAKKAKNVKILKPEFIEECQTCDAYLNERDYFLKL